MISKHWWQGTQRIRSTAAHRAAIFSQCKMTIVQPTAHVRVHVALTRQSPPAANVLFKMGQKRTPKTVAGEREQWTKEWEGEGTATVPDTSEGMGRQQPVTAVCSCSTKIPQRPPSNHPCLLDCFPYSLCSSRCRSNLRDLCMPYLSALLSCQPTLSACSSPATTASLAVLLWTMQLVQGMTRLSCTRCMMLLHPLQLAAMLVLTLCNLCWWCFC